MCGDNASLYYILRNKGCNRGNETKVGCGGFRIAQPVVFNKHANVPFEAATGVNYD